MTTVDYADLDPRVWNELAYAADILSPPQAPYAWDPVGWIRQHVFIWSKQAEIAEAVRDHRFTACRSCHGAGKSFIAAWIICWWMSTHEDAIVVTSAPSANQVKNILWKEVRRAHRKAGLPGYITQGEIPEWKLNEEVVAFGRKPADYVDSDQAATVFQGIHAKHVLVVLDEGAGIPDWLANATETLVTNEFSRVLIIGNPTNPASYFAKVSKPGSGYHLIKIAYTDLPYVTGEQVPENVSERLTGEIWVEERRKRWGEESILWIARVLAEFPEIADDILFTPRILNTAIMTDRSSQAVSKVKGHQGFDIARLGRDKCVLYHNKFGYVRRKDSWGKLDTMQTVGRFIQLYPLDNPGAAPTTVIDVAGGLGAGPYDRLRELGYPVVPFNGGERAYNPHKFKNRRAEAFWEAKEAMDNGLIDIDELDEDLQAELLEIRQKWNSTGLIQIEDKDDIIKRLGHSPDNADAFVMSLQKTVDWAKALAVDTTPAAVNPKPPAEPTAEDLVRDIMEVKL